MVLRPNPSLPARIAILPLLLGLLGGCHGGAGAPEPDFGLAATPSSLAVPAGGSGYLTVTATRRNGFRGAIALTLAGAPAGIQAAGTIPENGGSVQVAILVDAAVPPQTLAHLAFAAQSGVRSHDLSFSLTVTAALPLGAASPDRVQASGGRQTAAGLENLAVAGEPVGAAAAQDAAGATAVRHGFKPDASAQNP